MSKDVLVTGGAGYIGSHMCKLLANLGFSVTVFDNLTTGHRWAVRWGSLIEGDLRDPAAVGAALRARRFDAVFHFGACSLVGESVIDPGKYYENNVSGTLNLLQAMRREGVPRIVFSSTAAVYGKPDVELIGEDHAKRPINPYGKSKLMVETILDEFAAAYRIASAALRYFNAAGASESAEIGEAHDPETHLIPNVLRAAIERRPVQVFGVEYPTRDGTCIRDYIHVTDLCTAHLKAMERIQVPGSTLRLNLGTGHGHTVREVIAAAGAVCGAPIATVESPRRAGDPEILVADAREAQRVLDWQPGCSGLDNIIGSAWAWEQARQRVCEPGRATVDSATKSPAG
jgi:UDP-glucose 4-epimerase